MDCEKCQLMKDMGAKRPTCIECGKVIPLEVVLDIEGLLNNYHRYFLKKTQGDFHLDSDFIIKYAEENGYENHLFFLKLVQKAIEIISKREGESAPNNG